MDEKNGGPLSVLHVSERGNFRFGFQNLGETLLGVLLVPACGPCFVDLSDNLELGASLFQVRRVTGLQRLSSCANWSFDEGCPKSCFLHRVLHGGLFHVLIGEDSSRDPFVFSTLRHPRCMEQMALVGLMVTL